MSSFWGTPKEEEKKVQVDDKKKKKTTLVGEEVKKEEKPEEKKEEKKEEDKKEEKDKKTPLFEKKREEKVNLSGDLPEGVLESSPISTIIEFKNIETRKFMHINLEDLLKLDENSLVKIKGIKFNVMNWNDEKCQTTSFNYTNTPLVDSEINDWCVEDFIQTFKTTNKDDDFIVEEPKCVWTLKSDTDNVDTTIFHTITPDEKKIVKADQQIASEVLYLRDKDTTFSLGTGMFQIKRTSEGAVCLCVEISVFYEKKPF